MIKTRPYQESDEAAVAALWREVFSAAHDWTTNDEDIRCKLEVQREMFLVAHLDDELVGTALAGRKVEPQPIEFAEPVEPPGDQARVLDKLWIWVVLAVLLVLVSYALPIFQHLQLERFGAPGFRVY